MYNYIYVQYLHSKHIYSYGKKIVVKIIRLYSIKSKNNMTLCSIIALWVMRGAKKPGIEWGWPGPGPDF